MVIAPAYNWTEAEIRMMIEITSENVDEIIASGYRAYIETKLRKYKILLRRCQSIP